MISELNSFLRGWLNYFRYAECKTHLQTMDAWVRRKLRCVKLKQRKRRKPMVDFLHQQGVPLWRAWPLAWSGVGWWRKAGSPQAAEAMPNAWFNRMGLLSLSQQYAQLQHP